MRRANAVLLGTLIAAAALLAYRSRDHAEKTIVIAPAAVRFSVDEAAGKAAASALLPLEQRANRASDTSWTLQPQQQQTQRQSQLEQHPQPQPQSQQVATLQWSSPPPPPPPCTSLSCTTKLRSLEPPWAKLDFQPRINWAAGGVRGDCVVGEIEWIQPAYCSPKRVRNTWVASHGLPSEERLAAADVHSAPLPKSDLLEVAEMLPNQTLLIIGDSVMEQFYNALQCMLRKEELELPPDSAFLAFIKRNEPLWKMGKRKMPPKLPQKARTGMRMLFSRQVNFQPTDVDASLASGQVIVVNWGLHYHDMDQYRADLHRAFAQFDAHAAKTGHAVLFRETGAQHFKAADERGVGTLKASNGEWERRDRTTDRHCACAPIEDFGVNRQNGVLHEVANSGRYPRVRVLPFYELTRPRWRWHFGNCTHRPNGWNWDTCCDCSHFCYSPNMWRAHLFELKQLLRASFAMA